MADLHSERIVVSSSDESQGFEPLLASLMHRFNGVRSRELGEQIPAAVQQILAFFDFDWGAVHECPREPEEWGHAEAWSIARRGKASPDLAISAEFPWLREKARNGSAAFIAHPDQFPFAASREKRELARCRLKSLALIPLSLCGRCVGTLMLSTRTERPFPQRDTQRLRLVGEILATTLDRRRVGQRLRLTMAAWESAHDGILITDARTADQPIVYASRSFERLTGYRRQEIIGRNCRFLQGEDTDGAVRARIREAVTRAEPFQAEILNYRKNGEPFWNLLRLAPLKDSAGRLTHYAGVQTDVTRRKATELALAERLAFEQLLSRVSRLFINAPARQTDARVRSALRAIVETLKIDSSALIQFSGDRALLPESHIFPRPTGTQVPTDVGEALPWFTRALRSGRTLILPSLPDDLPAEAEAERRHCLAMGWKSTLTVPLITDSGVVGALALTSLRAARPWTSAQVEHIHILADIFRNALTSQRAEIEREGARRFESLLAAVAESFVGHSGAETDERFTTSLRWIVETLGVDRATLAEFSDELSPLKQAYAWPDTESGRHEPVSEFPPWAARRLLRGGVSRFMHLPQDLPLGARAERDYCVAQGIKSMLVVPLGEADSRLGALAIATTRSYREWSTEDVQRTLLLGEVFANALQRWRIEASLRDNEQRLRLITDALPVLIAYVDRHERYQFVNRGYEEWFGIPRDLILGRETWAILGEPAYAHARRHIAKALAGEEVHFEMTVPYRKGGVRDVDGRYIPARDESGKVQGYYALIQDVSSRKEAEREGQAQREQLTHAMRVATMGELTASIAHEINQPLAAILSNAQAAQRLLSSDPVDIAEACEALADIVADDKRAGEVIRRLRSLARKGSAEFRNIDINTVIRDSVALVKSDAVAKKVGILLELAPDLPALWGDAVQLQQVTLNLILNAFDAMAPEPDAPRELLLRTSRQGSAVCVAVRDTGVGLSQPSTESLFAPFFTTKPQGLGMGLAISRSIVEAHGGALRVRPNVGRGITCEFTLPVEEAP